MSALRSVAVITGSTRAVRVGPKVATLVQEAIASDAKAASIKLASVDVASFKLPVFDEPVVPAMVPAYASYAHKHTQAWSDEIAAHDGYVFVIPEYNYGIAGATKNAVDFLYSEWKGKPALIVSYGVMGGTKASEQLNQILNGIGLRVAETRPALAFGGQNADAQAASTKGELGAEKAKEWAEKEGDTIRKAFGELKELLAKAKE